jgi:hypothetical protein
LGKSNAFISEYSVELPGIEPVAELLACGNVETDDAKVRETTCGYAIGVDGINVRIHRRADDRNHSDEPLLALGVDASGVRDGSHAGVDQLDQLSLRVADHACDIDARVQG